MCSKNQEVDPLFAQFITKDFLIQRIFRVLRNSLFRTNDLYFSIYPIFQTLPALPDRLPLKADLSLPVNLIHHSFLFAI